MAISQLSPVAIPLRFGGSFLFVATSYYLSTFLLPDGFSADNIPELVMLILIGCGHLYLLVRAYQSLQISGFIIFTLLYGLLAYYMKASLGLEAGLGSLAWFMITYLTLLYGYGLSFNHIDAALAGLLHVRGT